MYIAKPWGLHKGFTDFSLELNEMSGSAQKGHLPNPPLSLMTVDRGCGAIYKNKLIGLE